MRQRDLWRTAARKMNDLREVEISYFNKAGKYRIFYADEVVNVNDRIITVKDVDLGERSLLKSRIVAVR